MNYHGIWFQKMYGDLGGGTTSTTTKAKTGKCIDIIESGGRSQLHLQNPILWTRQANKSTNLVEVDLAKRAQPQTPSLSQVSASTTKNKNLCRCQFNALKSFIPQL